MKGDKFIISKVDTSLDMDYNVCDILTHFVKKYRYSEKPEIIESVKRVKELLTQDAYESIDAFTERTKKFRELIGHYYCIKPSNSPYYYYAYIYQLIEENDTLWMVYCTDDTDVWHGGFTDGNKSLTDEWNCDLEFEEISEENFLTIGKLKNEKVYDARLEKLKNDPDRYNIHWENNEIKYGKKV